MTAIVDLVLNMDNNNVSQSSEDVDKQFPILEDIETREILSKSPHRNVRTHLPYSLLPRSIHEGKGKVCYSHETDT